MYNHVHTHIYSVHVFLMNNEQPLSLPYFTSSSYPWSFVVEECVPRPRQRPSFASHCCAPTRQGWQPLVVSRWFGES